MAKDAQIFDLIQEEKTRQLHGIELIASENFVSDDVMAAMGSIPTNKYAEGLPGKRYYGGCEVVDKVENLAIERLKELAYRVIAVDTLIKGYAFSDTFDLLHRHYKLNRDKSFAITLRVHRGGGFTKDHLYLKGLKKIYKYASQGKDLGILLTGKVDLKYIETINKLQDLGLAIPPRYITDAYETNDNKNPDLDFILKGLK